LAAGRNLFYDSSFELSRYTHSVLLYRIRPDDRQAEYRSLGDYGDDDPLPKVISITNAEQRAMYYNFSHGYWFAHFATVFPNVKPTKAEQKRYGIDATGYGETWAEEIVDEEMIKAMFNESSKGLDEGFFAAFDELAQLYDGDVAFEPLKEAVEISRARKEKGEELTPEEKKEARRLIETFFAIYKPQNPNSLA